MISQEELVRLANLHEPEASASPPTYRPATCVVCSRPMTSMWHCWLHEGGFKKEIHLCLRCGEHYGLFVEEPPLTSARDPEIEIDDGFGI